MDNNKETFIAKADCPGSSEEIWSSIDLYDTNIIAKSPENKILARTSCSSFY